MEISLNKKKNDKKEKADPERNDKNEKSDSQFVFSGLHENRDITKYKTKPA